MFKIKIPQNVYEETISDMQNVGLLHEIEDRDNLFDDICLALIDYRKKEIDRLATDAKEESQRRYEIQNLMNEQSRLRQSKDEEINLKDIAIKKLKDENALLSKLKDKSDEYQGKIHKLELEVKGLESYKMLYEEVNNKYEELVKRYDGLVERGVKVVEPTVVAPTVLSANAK